MNFKTNKTALITGGTGAIGEAIAWNIASDHNFRVFITCRDENKGIRSVEKIRKISGNQNVDYRAVDLSSFVSITKLAVEWKEPLHLLVNNACESPRQRMETSEGIERQFASNVLGYFRMIRAFTEILKNSAPARIVNVASYWAGGLDFGDLEFRKRRYDNDEAYRQSKQADRMLTVAFAERLKEFKITVNACHPGDVNSKLSNDLGFGGHESQDEGAATPAWLATSKDVEGITGKYFEHFRQERCRFGEARAAVERLYQICEKY
jgi:NAD(P)-dependent dehydrogenase (short-subunit alcohol dehydrogenase family)